MSNTNPTLTSARSQLLDNGYCVIDDALDAETIASLRTWSNEHLARTTHSAKWKYQGSDIHLSGERHRSKRMPDLPADPVIDRLIDRPRHLLDALGLQDFMTGGTYQIISKPAGAPALYWHQDWARWDDPISMSPWPQQVFVNWYLTDTSPSNGCLRLIPGSHRRRTALHEHLVAPHEGGGYEVEETNEWMFLDHPDAIAVPVRAGQVVIADARLLHGTYANDSTERRTLLLGWYYRRSNAVPEGWSAPVPPEIIDRDPDLPFHWNRVPGAYLK